MCTSCRKRDGHSRKVGFPDFRCVHVGRELRFAWLVSFCCFPVKDVRAPGRCHYVDTEPRRLRRKIKEKIKNKVGSYPAMWMQLMQFAFTGYRGQALEEWERLVRQYDAQSSDTLQDTTKAAVLTKTHRIQNGASTLE